MSTTEYLPTTRVLTTLGMFAVAALAFASEASFAASTLYATNDGTDSAGCGQKTNPCRSIGQAIRNASSGDTVLVGAGHYGDLNADGQFGGPGEEQLAGCMICINKPLRVLSLHGARVTIINGAAEPNSANTVVFIDANNVTFGAVNAGFTITGGSVVGLGVKGANIRIGGNIAIHDGQDGFAFGSVNGLQVTDNYSSGNTFGFELSGGNNKGAIIFERNVATDNSGSGFTLGGNDLQVSSNIATHNNGAGMMLDGSRLIFTDNTVADNVEGGVFISGLLSPLPGEFVKTFRGNTLTGNFGPGLYMGIPIQTLTGNNFYGNDTNATRVTQVPGQHCGIVNATTSYVILALNNFWGRQGPNQPDGGDAVGGVCDVSGTTVFNPFVTQGFAITK